MAAMSDSRSGIGLVRASTDPKDVPNEQLQLPRKLLWPLQRHVVDGVLEPAHPCPGPQLEGTFDAGDLAGSPLGGIRRLSRRQDQQRTAHAREQFGRTLFPERAD